MDEELQDIMLDKLDFHGKWLVPAHTENDCMPMPDNNILTLKNHT